MICLKTWTVVKCPNFTSESRFQNIYVRIKIWREVIWKVGRRYTRSNGKVRKRYPSAKKDRHTKEGGSAITRSKMNKNQLSSSSFPLGLRVKRLLSSTSSSLSYFAGRAGSRWRVCRGASLRHRAVKIKLQVSTRVQFP